MVPERCIQSIPKLTIPGGIMVGCEAGFMNGAKIKGTHTAMQSGITAAEVIASQLQTDNPQDEIENYKAELDKTWLMPELHQARNFSPLLKSLDSCLVHHWFGSIRIF